MQVNKIEIQLDSLDARINMGLADAYQAGFSVVTQRDVNDSNKSYHCTRHVTKAQNVELDADGTLSRNSNREEESKDQEVSNLNWKFDRVANRSQSSPPAVVGLNAEVDDAIEVVHHLNNSNAIFENSLEEGDIKNSNLNVLIPQHQASQSSVKKEPPFASVSQYEK